MVPNSFHAWCVAKGLTAAPEPAVPAPRHMQDDGQEAMSPSGMVGAAGGLPAAPGRSDSGIASPENEAETRERSEGDAGSETEMGDRSESDASSEADAGEDGASVGGAGIKAASALSISKPVAVVPGARAATLQHGDGTIVGSRGVGWVLFRPDRQARTFSHRHSSPPTVINVRPSQLMEIGAQVQPESDGDCCVAEDAGKGDAPVAGSTRPSRAAAPPPGLWRTMNAALSMSIDLKRTSRLRTGVFVQAGAAEKAAAAKRLIRSLSSMDMDAQLSSKLLKGTSSAALPPPASSARASEGIAEARHVLEAVRLARSASRQGFMQAAHARHVLGPAAPSHDDPRPGFTLREEGMAVRDVYVGQLSGWSGKRHGLGACKAITAKFGEYVFEGDWEHGLPSGHGLFTFPDGGTYAGAVEFGVAAGFGVMTFASGAVHEGQWAASGMSGFGQQLDASGRVQLSGRFVDSKPVRSAVVMPPQRDTESPPCVMLEGDDRLAYVEPVWV